MNPFRITRKGATVIAFLLALVLLQNCTAHAGPADSDQSTRVRLSVTADVIHGQGYWSPSLRIGQDGGFGLRVGRMQPPAWAKSVPEEIRQEKPQFDLNAVSYVEVDKEFCGERWCAALGIAKLSDKSYMNGTEWNFGVHFRYAMDKNWSLVLDHYSHGSMLGIEKEKSNRGWNLLGVAYTWW